MGSRYGFDRHQLGTIKNALKTDDDETRFKASEICELFKPDHLTPQQIDDAEIVIGVVTYGKNHDQMEQLHYPALTRMSDPNYLWKDVPSDEWPEKLKMQESFEEKRAQAQRDQEELDKKVIQAAEEEARKTGFKNFYTKVLRFEQFFEQNWHFCYKG